MEFTLIRLAYLFFVHCFDSLLSIKMLREQVPVAGRASNKNSNRVLNRENGIRVNLRAVSPRHLHVEVSTDSKPPTQTFHECVFSLETSLKRKLTCVDADEHARVVKDFDISDRFHQDQLLRWVAYLVRRHVKIRCALDADSGQEPCYLNFRQNSHHNCIFIPSS